MSKINIELEASQVAHLFSFLQIFGIPSMKAESETANHLIALNELININEDLKRQFCEKVTPEENKKIINDNHLRYGS